MKHLVFMLTLLALVAMSSPLHMEGATPVGSGRALPNPSPDGIWEEWEEVDPLNPTTLASPLDAAPGTLRAYRLNEETLKAFLARAPEEKRVPLKESTTTISVPMPDGHYARFSIVESPIMAPELAEKFPQIKTYRGRGIDNRSATARFDISPLGFHAQIFLTEGVIYIDPAIQNDVSVYLTTYRRAHPARGAFQCLVDIPGNAVEQGPRLGSATESGSEIRTYRLACATTGEYTAFFGGTVPAGLAAVVIAINRVTGIYERDLSIRLELVPNNDFLIYTSPSTDPYTNEDGISMLAQNQVTVDSVIGSANYDIGHVFSTGGGGVATLRSVGHATRKARGVTGRSTPIGDPFYVDYVAHEIGHQFGANHTFNGDSNACAGNRVASTAMEPGSGSTIMAYAGICGNDDLQSNSDPYFHSISLDEILTFVDLNIPSVGTRTATGNAIPSVSAGSNHTIPQHTLFNLDAVVSDADSETLTVSWEQRDLGPVQDVNADDNGSSPLFRFWSPTVDRQRNFPRQHTPLGETLVGEKWAITDRTMTFRATVRDLEGAINSDDTAITVTTAAGPFWMTFPTHPTILSSLTETVEWQVGGTNVAPIFTTTVDIFLSLDGGLTFPYPLAIGTPNDGSETVTFPPIPSATARIKIEATNNIFFAMSAANFSLFPDADYAEEGLVSGCAPTGVPVCSTEGPYVSLLQALTLGSKDTLFLKANAGVDALGLRIDEPVTIRAWGGRIRIGN